MEILTSLKTGGASGCRKEKLLFDFSLVGGLRSCAVFSIIFSLEMLLPVKKEIKRDPRQKATIPLVLH